MSLSNVDGHAFVTAKAAEDLSEKQHHLVKYNEAGEIVVCTEGAAGYVLTDQPAEGEYGTVVVGSERQKAVAGASIKVGENLTSNGSGELIVAVAASGHLIVGIAREAGVSGDIVEILTVPPVTKA